MPVITLLSPDPSPGTPALARIAASVTGLLGIPAQHCWLTWQQLDADAAHRPEWERAAAPGQGDAPAAPRAPIGFVTCKETYPRETVGRLLRLLRDELAALTGVPGEEVYLAVRRAVPGELLIRGDVWAGDEPASAEVVSVPVGRVVGGRTEVRDDHWDTETAIIRLDASRYGPEAVAGLDAFSHLEIVYHFDRVPTDKIQTGARHPRNNTDWPLVGIFAQRGKNRPNRLGVSRCRLVKTDGLDLHVQGLDAIDGTPVLDIKPYMAEFGPRGETTQPEWATAIMRDYY